MHEEYDSTSASAYIHHLLRDYPLMKCLWSPGTRLKQIATEGAQYQRAGVQLAEFMKVLWSLFCRYNQLPTISQRPDWRTAYRVYQSNSDAHTWHIVHSKENQELVNPTKLEEVIITLQGIIWKHDLPPFMDKIPWVIVLFNHLYRFIHMALKAQTKSCSFLATEHYTDRLWDTNFEHSIQSLMEAHALYERHVPAGKLDECSIIDKCSDFLGIHLTNWYLHPAMMPHMHLIFHSTLVSIHMETLPTLQRVSTSTMSKMLSNTTIALSIPTEQSGK